MNWKKLGETLLFPPMAVLVILLPAAAVFLIYAMVRLGTESPMAIASYVLAFYTLTVWCCRIPQLIRSIRTFKNENRYARRWLDDTRLRVNVSLYAGLVWNIAYAALQLALGAKHRSFWFCSLSGYYFSLAVMRWFLVRYTRRFGPGEKLREELIRYRRCGWIFLLMNLALTLMIFFMVYWNRTFVHHQITAIAMAAYTFGSLTMAIIGTVRYRRYSSPVYSASKAISLASACVSVLTLETTLLTAFGDGTMTLTARRILLGTSGGAVSAFIIWMALHMIVQGTKRLKLSKKDED